MERRKNQFSLEFYEESLALLRHYKYEFIFFNEIKNKSKRRQVIWRHDVDFSPQAALNLARMEHDNSVKGTYFFQLGSQFYNVFENNIKDIIKEIVSLKHQVGIHFDIGAYNINSEKLLEKYLKFEKIILEEICNKKITVFSFHNPTLEAQNFRKVKYSEMINVYSDDIRSSFKYCSDSNGGWKEKNMQDFIKENNQRIQILTHPGWWIKNNELSPNNKIKHLLDLRKKKTLDDYNKLLHQDNRPNK